ncbi:PTS sugar transporter subunit IIA [Lacticaseibacillus zeae]|nr:MULTISPECIES: PTS sugar transporter subunit IIA [Lacticaseibacillus]KLI75093.1 PTS sugar transporter subunit IIA [Lacticaseibacillus casei]TLF38003.1 PTS sugar transporter subunit IIA [Lacticaseibacillus zeae]TLF40721.1 PTS sugar transporter subunit IIA [Lacticaseibacillus zeae]
MAEALESDLFDSKLVFVEDGDNQDTIFKQVSDRLLAAGAVKSDFYQHLSEREKSYPTGIDMSVVNPAYPNVAIPHTEGEFVNVRKVVPIRLEKPIEFANMIAPDQKLQVSFLFMILNNDPEGQANVLAQIMDFLTTSSAETLKSLFQAEDPATIYKILVAGFKK